MKMVSNKKSRWWRGFILLFVFSAFVFFTTSCAKLEQALEEAGFSMNKISEQSGESGDVHISGRVMKIEDNEPAGYSEIRIEVGSSTFKGHADSNGYFDVNIDDLGSGSSIIVKAFYSGSTEINQKELKLGTDYESGYSYIDAKIIYIRGESGGVISGHITYGPYPLRDVTLTLTSGSETKTGSTDGHGFYVFSGLEDGQYTITPSLEGFEIDASSESSIVAAIDSVKRKVEDQNFKMTPNEANKENFNTEGLGIIRARVVGPGEDATQDMPLPPFIINASAKIDVDGREVKTFVERHNSSFIFYGIPAGSYSVRIILEVDEKQMDPNSPGGIKILEDMFPLLSVEVGVHGDLPEYQVITLSDQNFNFKDEFNDFQDENFNRIWVEQEVRIQLGFKDEPVHNAKIVFTKGSEKKEVTTDFNGWFGLDLPSSGTWKFEVFNPASAAEPTISKDVEIGERMYDPRGWYPGFVFIEGDVDEIIENMTKREITGQLRLNNQQGNQTTDWTGVKIVFYSVNNDEYQVTVNVLSDGSFSAELAPLGEFRLKIAEGDYKIQNPNDNYWIDEWSSHNNFEIWLRGSVITHSSRVVVKYGWSMVGVPNATIRLLKDGVEKYSALSNESRFAANVGKFDVQVTDNADLIGEDWILEISGDSIKTKEFPLYFEKNQWGDIRSNLFDDYYDGFKVTPTAYIGAKFDTVVAKLNCNDLDKIKNATAKLIFVNNLFNGVPLTVEGTTDSNGRAIFTNVPAIGADAKIEVTKDEEVGSSYHSSNSPYYQQFDHMDVSAANSSAGADDTIYFPWANPSHSTHIWFEEAE
jgi:hypothetical protein